VKERTRIVEDPIVAEVRACRAERARRFKHDIDAMFDDLRRMEAESRSRGATIVEPPARNKNLVPSGKRRKERDALVEEVRRHRLARAAKFGFSIDAIAEDARKRERKSGHKVLQPPKRKAMRKHARSRASAAR
jgi:hypothetical protein